MIAKPLVWIACRTACGRYRVHHEGGRWPKWHAHHIKENGWEVGVIIGDKFKSLEAAQAACEFHHQIAAVRTLNLLARAALDDFIDEGRLAADVNKQWREIIAAADAADNPAKAGVP